MTANLDGQQFRTDTMYEVARESFDFMVIKNPLEYLQKLSLPTIVITRCFLEIPLVHPIDVLIALLIHHFKHPIRGREIAFLTKAS